MGPPARVLPGSAGAGSRARREWFPVASVRARATAGALLVAGVASVSGSLVFLSLLGDHLVTSIDEALEARAQDVVALARAGTLPGRLAVFGGEGEDDALIQVVDRSGRVVAASVNIPEGEGPLFPDAVPREWPRGHGRRSPRPSPVTTTAT